jgi:hypothetical protein
LVGVLKLDQNLNVLNLYFNIKLLNSIIFFKISLEFFTRKKRSWPLNFHFENIPWEIWTVKIELMQLSNENGRFKIKIKYFSFVLLIKYDKIKKKKF